MENWRIEVLPSTGLCGASCPVSPSTSEFALMQSDTIRLSGQRHGS
jgi:hypothetical protein